jgi:hypothetical protein
MAAIDMAAASGLRLVPRNLRDPCRTTTYGVGELIAAALDDGCTRIIIGCGDSGTSDGGAGMLQALGVRLLDDMGIELPKAGGGIDLSDLGSMDLHSIHPRLRPDAIGMHVPGSSSKYVLMLTQILCALKHVVTLGMFSADRKVLRECLVRRRVQLLRMSRFCLLASTIWLVLQNQYYNGTSLKSQEVVHLVDLVQVYSS